MHALAMSEAIDIKALRKSINWNQDRLARYLGIDRSSVSHMENGRPAVGAVLRLLHMLVAAAANGNADALCPTATQEAAE